MMSRHRAFELYDRLIGGDGVALDGGQNARRWYYDRGWRRGYQNTGWGHGTRHLCDKRCGVRHRRTKEHSQQIR